MKPTLNDVLNLTRRGWCVFPIAPGGKRPLCKWRDRSAQAEGIARLEFTKYSQGGEHPNIGVDCGKSGLVVLDLDRHDGGPDGLAAWEALKVEHGIDDTGALVAETASGGRHLIFTDPTGGAIRNSAGKLAPGVDVRGNGGYIVAPPSSNGAGGGWRWLRGDGEPGPLPPEVIRLLLAEPTRSESPETLREPLSERNGPNSDKRGTAYAQAALESETATLAGTAPGERNDQANRSAFALGQLVGAGLLDRTEVERRVYDACVGNGLVADDGERSVRATLASGLNAGIAEPRRMPPKREGAVITKNSEYAQLTSNQESDPDVTKDAIPTPSVDGWLSLAVVKEALNLGETGDAELVTNLYRDRVVFDHTEGSWYLWDGHNWQIDRKEKMPDLVAYKIAAQYLNAAAEAQQSGADKEAMALTKRAKSLRQRNRINNVLTRARSQSFLALAGYEWDTNPWKLGVKNGVLDLHTGEFAPGRPNDYIRQAAPTEWHGIDTPSPRWERFLLEIFAGDQELVNFVQRLLGYGITGLSVEHVLPVLWGKGRNGKGTLLEVIGAVLGPSLAIPTESSVLMSAGYSSGNSPQPFVYALRGTRLVWASETSEGQRLNTAVVKKLTGGDTIFTRTLHSKPIRFTPSYLILMLTNNRPHVDALDQAIWDRLHLIEFTQRFVDNPQGEGEHLKDKYLVGRLKAEAPGVLAWLVRGCLAWQREEGLDPPDSVKAATAAYREEEDTLGQFITECVITKKGERVRAQSLYDAYTEWCERNHLKELTGTTFGKKVKRHYFDSGRDEKGVYYKDVCLM